MNELWSSVDQYFEQMIAPSNPILEEVLETNAKAGLPAIDVSPNQGRLLQIFVQMINAQSVLEIGTLGGYSTIWMAQGLPSNGRIITLECEQKHAEIARSNIARAGFSNMIDVQLGNALETLPLLYSNNERAFDFIFIDADKKSNADYFSWALKLSHPGTIIIVDNVVRKGAVVDAASTDENVLGVRKLNELIKRESKVNATVVQTVGVKGYDGFIIARVL